MSIYVNGEPRECAEVITVAELLRGLGVAVDAAGVAVSVNGAVVTRQRWAETALAGGDRLEIIRATQGG
jgi:sulfur carrier protein